MIVFLALIQCICLAQAVNQTFDPQTWFMQDVYFQPFRMANASNGTRKENATARSGNESGIVFVHLKTGERTIDGNATNIAWSLDKPEAAEMDNQSTWYTTGNETVMLADTPAVPYSAYLRLNFSKIVAQENDSMAFSNTSNATASSQPPVTANATVPAPVNNTVTPFTGFSRVTAGQGGTPLRRLAKRKLTDPYFYGSFVNSMQHSTLQTFEDPSNVVPYRVLDHRLDSVRTDPDLSLFEEIAYTDANDQVGKLLLGDIELGSGKFGRVVHGMIPSASDPNTLQHVAVKLMKDEKLVKTEIGAAAKAGVLLGKVEQGFVMKLAEGVTLKSFMEQHALQWTEGDIETIAQRLQTTLQQMHSRKLIHGDAHPGNMIVTFAEEVGGRKLPVAMELIDFGELGKQVSDVGFRKFAESQCHEIVECLHDTFMVTTSHMLKDASAEVRSAQMGKFHGAMDKALRRAMQLNEASGGIPFPEDLVRKVMVDYMRDDMDAVKAFFAKYSKEEIPTGLILQKQHLSGSKWMNNADTVVYVQAMHPNGDVTTAIRDVSKAGVAKKAGTTLLYEDLKFTMGSVPFSELESIKDACKRRRRQRFRKRQGSLCLYEPLVDVVDAEKALQAAPAEEEVTKLFKAAAKEGTAAETTMGRMALRTGGKVVRIGAKALAKVAGPAMYGITAVVIMLDYKDNIPLGIGVATAAVIGSAFGEIIGSVAGGMLFGPLGAIFGGMIGAYVFSFGDGLPGTASQAIFSPEETVTVILTGTPVQKQKDTLVVYGPNALAKLLPQINLPLLQKMVVEENDGYPMSQSQLQKSLWKYVEDTTPAKIDHYYRMINSVIFTLFAGSRPPFTPMNVIPRKDVVVDTLYYSQREDESFCDDYAGRTFQLNSKAQCNGTSNATYTATINGLVPSNSSAAMSNSTIRMSPLEQAPNFHSHYHLVATQSKYGVEFVNAAYWQSKHGFAFAPTERRETSLYATSGFRNLTVGAENTIYIWHAEIGDGRDVNAPVTDRVFWNDNGKLFDLQRGDEYSFALKGIIRSDTTFYLSVGSEKRVCASIKSKDDFTVTLVEVETYNDEQCAFFQETL